MKQVENGNIATPKGFSAFGIHCGIKKKKLDLGVIVSDVPAAAAAVYTQNRSVAAPVVVTKKVINHSRTLQAVVVNSGVANACTGIEGIQDACKVQEILSKKIDIPETLIGVASTGVIGPKLPVEKIESGINQLDWSENEPINFHKSILTTDTKTKEICFQATIDGKHVSVSGVAKGSGMIQPNMATMLAFITTDVNISSDLLDEMLKETTNHTFNQITVDGDTSTNDMVIVMANGQSNTTEITKGSTEYLIFKEMFEATCECLAKKIAEDGEGATKLIEVSVIGAKLQNEANQLAKQVVGSNLVKAAMFGEDPNWGRIICAVGNAGIAIDINDIDIIIEGVLVFEKGCPVSFDTNSMSEKLKNHDLKIVINLNAGDECGKAWGCDLTYDYVRINAVYHT